MESATNNMMFYSCVAAGMSFLLVVTAGISPEHDKTSKLSLWVTIPICVVSSFVFVGSAIAHKIV